MWSGRSETRLSLCAVRRSPLTPARERPGRSSEQWDTCRSLGKLQCRQTFPLGVGSVEGDIERGCSWAFADTEHLQASAGQERIPTPPFLFSDL